jgi:predicted flap endonuclease-1-like 5' DNA nuclease
MAYSITEVEGIGEAYAAKLRAAGISTTEALLEHCATKAGRKTIAEKTGIDEKHLLTWVNHADLMRISGIGGQFSELLEAAGVDTVKELRTRNAANLTEAMKQHNAQRNLTKGILSEAKVQNWIEQAKNIEPMVSH